MLSWMSLAFATLPLAGILTAAAILMNDEFAAGKQT